MKKAREFLAFWLIAVVLGSGCGGAQQPCPACPEPEEESTESPAPVVAEPEAPDEQAGAPVRGVYRIARIEIPGEYETTPEELFQRGNVIFARLTVEFDGAEVTFTYQVLKHTGEASYRSCRVAVSAAVRWNAGVVTFPSGTRGEGAVSHVDVTGEEGNQVHQRSVDETCEFGMPETPWRIVSIEPSNSERPSTIVVEYEENGHRALGHLELVETADVDFEELAARDHRGRD